MISPLMEMPQEDKRDFSCGILPPWMLKRTPLCKHKHGCTENVIIGFYQTFANMLAIKLLVNNVAYIGNLKKLIANLLSFKSIKDNMRWALFLAIMNATYKFFLCIFRRILKSDKYAAPFAGFLAGLTSKIDLKSRRELFLVLILSRLTDATYSMAEDRGYVTRIKYGELITFLICSMT